MEKDHRGDPRTICFTPDNTNARTKASAAAASIVKEQRPKSSHSTRAARTRDEVIKNPERKRDELELKLNKCTQKIEAHYRDITGVLKVEDQNTADATNKAKRDTRRISTEQSDDSNDGAHHAKPTEKEVQKKQQVETSAQCHLAGKNKTNWTCLQFSSMDQKRTRLRV